MKKKKTSFGNEKKLILVIIVISIVAFFHFSKQDTQISYSNYECQSGRSEMTREEWQRIYYFHSVPDIMSFFVCSLDKDWGCNKTKS